MNRDSMGQHRGMVGNSMSNWSMSNWGMMSNSMSNGGMMGNSMDNWSMSNSMSNWGMSNDNRGSLDNRCLRVLWDSLVGDLSNIAIDIISGVGDSLGPAVRESHLVGASLSSKAIRGLGGGEGRARVVVSDSVVEVVGGDLSKVLHSSVASNRVGNSLHKGGSMGNMHRGSMGNMNRGSMMSHTDRSSMGNMYRGSMGHMDRSSMGDMHRGSMMGNMHRGSMSYSKRSSMKSILAYRNRFGSPQSRLHCLSESL